MFFGFSYGEVIVTVAVLAVVIGPKELPIIAKVAGRMTGQAAAFLSRSRSQWQKFAEENEIAQLHKEMQESLGQLRAIQNELRYGPQLMNPGPLAQRAMGVPPQRAAGEATVPDPAAPTHITPPKMTQRGAAADALNSGLPSEALLAERLASIDPQLLQALQDHLSGQAATHGRTALHRPRRPIAEDAEDQRQWSEGGSSAEGSLGQNTMFASSAGMQRSGDTTREGSGAASRHAANDKVATGGGPQPGISRRDDRGDEGVAPGSEAAGRNAPHVLPVSAVAMGLAPKRSGEGTLCGSDIAEDALVEEEVAHMAQRFFQQQQPPPDSSPT